MFFNKILKKENRKLGQERRKSNILYYNQPDKRKGSNRRKGEDRRKKANKWAGLYYKLSDNQKNAVDDIIAILEYEQLKRR